MKRAIAVHEIHLGPKQVVPQNDPLELDESTYAELLALGAIREMDDEEAALFDMVHGGATKRDADEAAAAEAAKREADEAAAAEAAKREADEAAAAEAAKREADEAAAAEVESKKSSRGKKSTGDDKPVSLV